MKRCRARPKKTRRAIYPGSFSPWHEGHQDILEKALKVFDTVIVARMVNPEKELYPVTHPKLPMNAVYVEVPGLLVDAVKKFQADSVIRGLRNGYDLQYEMNQQYWNEDLGLVAPVVYFICDRELAHVSSSAIRQLRSIDARRNIDRPSRRGKINRL